MAIRIKKGDKVVVVAGADKSDEPREVVDIDREGRNVLVQGVNVRWKHVKRSPENPDGGRVQREFPIDISNVMLFSEKAGKGVRVHIQTVDGKRKRVGTCGTQFD